ncbi:DUF3742 family protein [Xanthomonas hortorum]|uniref:DUF3742 family protein n=2 Tax=Xanthomonas hortorum TaxID=56454 RepID=A0A9X4H812_9XANT|nr:DUF3742 family protein [Xanthomonas hortorum]MDC8640750.1 DUF3742 family protein [Xanthomonas hortorum pv. hederae]
MKTNPQSSNPEKLGRWLGNAWRSYAMGERRLFDQLVCKGMSPAVLKILFWTVKLTVIALLLYFVFWVALLLVVLVGAARLASNADLGEMPEPEWKNGPAGFGLYTYDGFRIDPHVSDED